MGNRTVRSRALAVVMALLLVEGTGYLSFFMVQGRPAGPHDPTPPLECTSTLEAPIADTVLAALGVTALVLAATLPHGSPSANTAAGAVEVAGGIVALAGATSATVGYLMVADCARWKDIQLSCVSGVEASCRMLRGSEP